MKGTEAVSAVLGGFYYGKQRHCPFLETEAECHSGTKIPEKEKVLFMLESRTGFQFPRSCV